MGVSASIDIKPEPGSIAIVADENEVWIECYRYSEELDKRLISEHTITELENMNCDKLRTLVTRIKFKSSFVDYEVLAKFIRKVPVRTIITRGNEEKAEISLRKFASLLSPYSISILITEKPSPFLSLFNIEEVNV
jgi:hypothetical protein